MMANKEHEDLLVALREVVEASNRTNHAVRAIVLPSTIMLFALLVAVPLVLLSFAVDLIMLVLPGGVIVGGAIFAIIAQIKETAESEIPQPLEAFGLSRSVKTASTSLPSKEPSMTSEPSTSHGSCRFCGKPFPAGYYDSCPDCGKN
jgi:hypothetical protein